MLKLIDLCCKLDELLFMYSSVHGSVKVTTEMLYPMSQQTKKRYKELKLILTQMLRYWTPAGHVKATITKYDLLMNEKEKIEKRHIVGAENYVIYIIALIQNDYQANTFTN